MDACLIVTYRCNAGCYMCHTWKTPSTVAEEFRPELLDRLPAGLNFINVTGGEPFLRDDLGEIVDRALSKCQRLVISTNGYFTERIATLAERYRNRIGFRISIEGLPAANDELRGIKDGFDRGLRTLLTLRRMGIKDIGFGMTVSDRNARDMLELYWLASSMGLEFATATTHNSFYFHISENQIKDRDLVAGEFEKVALHLLQSYRPKNWFRAYFNMGLANKVRGGKRPLPCEVGSDLFFLDPYGNILPCNGSDMPMVMGNLQQETFEVIWSSAAARQVRREVAGCKKNCWMIGSVAPAMKKRIRVPLAWILRNKVKMMMDRTGAVCLDPLRKADDENLCHRD